ncbi:MAG: transposase [Rickettsiaceae bacterium]
MKKLTKSIFCNNIIGFKDFSKWLKQNKVVKVKTCMESTGIYGIFFANCLYEQNYNISIVNPVCINAFARSKLARHKTDKVDSLIIDEYATKYELRLYKPKDHIMSELKDLYRWLQNLKDQQKHINNLLENKSHIA